ncbi:MAG TPA: chemotaxis protein CheW [Anaeromyxobacteraceae bacterium]|nr:chemotaxis protein CheW [Anaeromyxobacteraceae bacterium]
MDFLSIRKKARERAGAKEAEGASRGGAAPAAPVPEPDPEREASASPAPAQAPRAPGERAESHGGEEGATHRERDTVPAESDLPEEGPDARFQALAPSPDGRFATWRPGAGPPPIEPDPTTYVTPPPPPREELHAPAPPPPPPEERGAGSSGGPARFASAPDPLDDFFYRPDEDAALVPSLGAVSVEEPIPARPEQLDELLTFRLGKEEFAVPIGRVREVLRAPAITEVPRAPAGVLGVVTVRGEIVPVVDAHARLGVAATGGSAGRILIVDADEGPLGVLVDAVESVVRLPRGTIEPCPQGLAAAASECVTGIGRWRERLFMVVEAGALLRRSRPAEGS